MFVTERLMEGFASINCEREGKRILGLGLMNNEEIEKRLLALSKRIHEETGFLYPVKDLLDLWDLYQGEQWKRGKA